MKYDFVADLDKNGICLRLDGDVESSLGGKAHRFVNRNFSDFVLPDARKEMLETLEKVIGDSAPIRLGLTLVGGDGVRRPFFLDIVAISRAGVVMGLRIGAAKIPEEAGLDAHQLAQGMGKFRDAIAANLSTDDPRILTIYEIDPKKIGAPGAEGDVVCRLNERTAAIVHGGDDAETMSTDGDLEGVSGFSVRLATGAVGSDSDAMAMIDGMLAAAAMPEFSLEDGLRTLTEAYDEAVDAVAGMESAPPHIRYAAMRGDADIRMGMCEFSELLTPHEGGTGPGSKLIETVVRKRLEQTAGVRPADIPICVPIHAASLLLMEAADWAKFDLMVMPKGMKALPRESQLAIARRLSAQNVMADIRDMAAVPDIFAGLFKSRALTRLYVDPRVFFDSQLVERMAFWRLVTDCAKRDVFAAFDGDSAVMISALTSGFDSVYVFEDETVEKAA